MGQHKFEKQIGRQLRDREIEPQQRSWEELSSRLEKEDKKSISLFFIAGIAASLTAAFLIFSLTYNHAPQTLQVVETPFEVIEEVGEEIEQQQVAFEEKQTTEKPVQGKQPAATKNQPIEIIAPKVERSTVVEVALVEKSPVVPGVEENYAPIEPALLKEGLIPAGLDEVIAELSARAGVNQVLSESEVDALLYKAAAEISANRDRGQFTGKIDATVLLMDVEMELDQTFREKVFDILKDGYLKARTAVANRNF